VTYPAAALAREAGMMSRGVHGFAREDDRARLTPPAIAAMRRLSEAWHLGRAEAAALLGASEVAWVRISCGVYDQSLSQDQLTRVAAAMRVFKALHTLFVDDIADRWPRLPNNAPMFADRSPLETMIDDGIPGMIEVRDYLDGLHGGT
jgi:uncharacterized protein (DUF2384 family)